MKNRFTIYETIQIRREAKKELGDMKRRRDHSKKIIVEYRSSRSYQCDEKKTCFENDKGRGHTHIKYIIGLKNKVVQ